MPTIAVSVIGVAFLLVLSSWDTPAGQSKTNTSLGRTVRFHLKSAPFPDQRRDDGYTYDDTGYPFSEHYDDSSVLVFIPRGWKEGPKLNLVFFFHGWYSSIDDSLDRFQLLEQFSASGVNALLVVPETARNAPDSSGGKLEDNNGFQQLVADLLAHLQRQNLITNAKLGQIVLAGHSGGYLVIAEILNHGGLPIRSVLLFDALYGRLDWYEDWLQDRHARLFSVFCDGSDTVLQNHHLADDLNRQGVRFLSEEEALEGHPFPRGTRAFFFHSTRDHYGVVADANQFELLVQSAFSRS